MCLGYTVQIYLKLRKYCNFGAKDAPFQNGRTKKSILREMQKGT